MLRLTSSQASHKRSPEGGEALHSGGDSGELPSTFSMERSERSILAEGRKPRAGDFGTRDRAVPSSGRFGVTSNQGENSRGAVTGMFRAPFFFTCRRL